MASITIRQLDEELKRRLRLRAARNGRSMEDEARTILRTAAALDDKAQLEEGAGSARILQREPKRRGVRADAAAPPAGNTHAGRTLRILLIIGGGIAAYKALDLIRRLKEHSLTVRCILTKAAQEFITPLSAGALSGERAFTDL
ncbi:MAG: bifunctional phosphopantothenoylcysteine decarboxylase/phosphopantothenate synthase, partial [Alphaproteobacteria bacterium]